MATQAYWNKPIAIEEKRFFTHDFSDVMDWDGRTNGAPAKSWAEDHGATKFDPIQKKFKNISNQTIAWLDNSTYPSIWRDNDDNVVVQYDEISSGWIRTDTNANVTNSRWTIFPNTNKKVQINYVRSFGNKDAIFQGILNYKVYGWLNQLPDGTPIPPNIYALKNFAYSTLDNLIAGSSKTEASPIGTGSLYITYDYKKDSVPPMIDSRGLMYLDIEIDNHLPILSQDATYATFYCIEIDSF